MTKTSTSIALDQPLHFHLGLTTAEPVSGPDLYASFTLQRLLTGEKIRQSYRDDVASIMFRDSMVEIDWTLTRVSKPKKGELTGRKRISGRKIAIAYRDWLKALREDGDDLRITLGGI